MGSTLSGRPPGYQIVNPSLGLTTRVIQTAMAFEWFSTMPGMKIAELTLLTDKGLEMPSQQDDAWPKTRYSSDHGFEVDIPSILIL